MPFQFANYFYRFPEADCIHTGMLLYGGLQRADDGDFVSLSLVNQRLQLRFNLGNGLALITYASLRIRTARWRECVYVLQMFFLFFLFFAFFRPPRKYLTTVLGNG